MSQSDHTASTSNGLSGALFRYRISAWIVGVFLILLVFFAMPMRYIGGDDTWSGIISPIHGFGYMVYLVLAFDLARRANWSLWPRTIMLLLAGTVPIMSFMAERWVIRVITEENAGDRHDVPTDSAKVTSD